MSPAEDSLTHSKNKSHHVLVNPVHSAFKLLHNLTSQKKTTGTVFNMKLTSSTAKTYGHQNISFLCLRRLVPKPDLESASHSRPASASSLQASSALA